jgi:hypothetical protein
MSICVSHVINIKFRSKLSINIISATLSCTTLFNIFWPLFKGLNGGELLKIQLFNHIFSKLASQHFLFGYNFQWINDFYRDLFVSRRMHVQYIVYTLCCCEFVTQSFIVGALALVCPLRYLQDKCILRAYTSHFSCLNESLG